MIFKGIDYPNDLVEALKNGKLVVFAGAGASIGSPTNLPNFSELVERIATDTGKKRKEDEECEVFLGNLKANGVPVNDIAAKILSKSCTEHNILHEAIIDLFPQNSEIKIVTTNYDKMFESVLKNRGLSKEIYSIPALPLGSDINGIIHIHGIVDNPQYMIVTDEDFGKAYLTEGYASKFLVSLFKTYTVLFIGYSYKDTILRYLTRAMVRENQNQRFILTSESDSDWKLLGINPIIYPEGKYDIMRESLEIFGESAKKNLVDWYEFLSRLGDKPPSDLTNNSIIEYCLEDKNLVKGLAKNIGGTDWAQKLETKEVFKGCFSNEIEFNDYDKVWGEWLCNNFVGKDDKYLLDLFYRKSNKISKSFSEILIKRIITCEEIDDVFFSEYVVILEKKLSNSFWILRLIEKAYKRKLYELSFLLYKKLFDYSFCVYKAFSFFHDSYEYKTVFWGRAHEIKIMWKLIKDNVIENNPYAVFIFTKNLIEEIYYKYICVKHGEYDEPLSILRLQIEDDENNDENNSFLILNQMLFDAAIAIDKQEAVFLREEIKRGVLSKSIFYRKVLLRILRYIKAFSYSEKLEIVLNSDLFDITYGQKQVFLLVADIYDSLTTIERKRIIDVLEKKELEESNIANLHKLFKWYVWLQRIDNNNTRLKGKIDNFVAEYDFQIPEHPEQEDNRIELQKQEDNSLSEGEFKKLNFYDAVDYLEKIKDRLIFPPYRYKFLNNFSNWISNDYNWAKGVLLALFDKNDLDEEIWEHFLEGVIKSNYEICDAIDMLHLLSDNTSDADRLFWVADYLFQTIRREDLNSCFGDYEEKLLNSSCIIWKKRPILKQEDVEVSDLVHNSVCGIIIHVWILLINNCRDKNIPKKFKSKLNDTLKLKSQHERGIAIYLYSGHLFILYSRDKNWCENNVIKYLIGQDESSFRIAWEGVAHYGTFYMIKKDFFPICLKAVKNISWLKENVKQDFIRMYLEALVEDGDNPNENFIPEFYRYTTDEERSIFINEIGQKLDYMDDDQEKKDWWNKWLRDFLNNRMLNKPELLSCCEKKAVIRLLPSLSFVFDEAVELICNETFSGVDVDYGFWFYIAEKHLGRDYPQSMLKVMKVLVNCNSNSDTDYIIEITDEMKGLREEEKRELKEILLIKNV